jgi:Tol biopolymer transport system component
MWLRSLSLLLLGGVAAAQSTNRVVGSAGQQGDADTDEPTISADGRFVAFGSLASNFAVDVNGAAEADVFVHDRLTGETRRVSESATGQGGNALSWFAVLSADGSCCVFRSWASNLVPGDTNGADDVFVKVLATGAIERISVSTTGKQGDAPSKHATLDADGRVVAFRSAATNLVPDDTNGVDDVFVHDRKTGVTKRISVSSTGEQGNAASMHADISDDGKSVGFRSSASNLVPGDDNGVDDVFVSDLATGLVTRLSVSSTGAEGDGESLYPSLSADGRFVAFMSFADNLVSGDGNGQPDIFVHDRQTATTALVSTGLDGAITNGASYYPFLSDDGSSVGFLSQASNLVPDDTNGTYDAFVKRLASGKLLRVSVGSAGEQGDDMSWRPRLSADGRVAVFPSLASTLVPGDSNGVWDVFLRDTEGPWTLEGKGLGSGASQVAILGKPGLNGGLHLAVSGGPEPGATLQISVGGGPPNVPALLFAGFSLEPLAQTNGLLEPHDDLVLGFPLGPAGSGKLTGLWPAGLPDNQRLFVQVWVQTPSGWLASPMAWAVQP